MNIQKVAVGLSVALLSLGTAPSHAENAQGIVAIWNGASTRSLPQAFGGTCPNTGCQGDLVTCGPGEALVVAKFAYSMLEGICDDDGPTPCAGKATGINEGCFDLTSPPAGKDIKVSGTILSVTVHGKERYCFDENALSDCTGASPNAAVMGEAAAVYQSRQMLSAPGPSQATIEHTLEDTNEFTLNGQKTRLKIGKVLISQFTAEPNSGTNCGGAGCGFAGNSVRMK